MSVISNLTGQKPTPGLAEEDFLGTLRSSLERLAAWLGVSEVSAAGASPWCS
jgi:hypothetical protein